MGIKNVDRVRATCLSYIANLC